MSWTMRITTDEHAPHPGELITDIYLEPNGISGLELTEKLGVAPFDTESCTQRQ